MVATFSVEVEYDPALLNIREVKEVLNKLIENATQDGGDLMDGIASISGFTHETPNRKVGG
jgi:hypothetical protein